MIKKSFFNIRGCQIKLRATFQGLAAVLEFMQVSPNKC